MPGLTAKTQNVVGIDFSPEADEGARQALGIARHIGGELVLVHVNATVVLLLGPGRSTIRNFARDA
jgi:nucleotide-binding universal stress UspA family protein